MSDSLFYNKLFTPDKLLESRLSQFPHDEDLKRLESILGEKTEVLDMGSGIGYAANYLAERGKNVTAVEPAFFYHDFAEKNKNPNAEYVNATIQDFVPQKPYDAVILMWSVINELTIPEQKEFVQKAYESLREGGILFFDTPYFRVDDKEVIEHNDEDAGRKFIISPDYTVRIVRPEGEHTIFCNTPLEYQLILNDAGFRDVKVDPYLTATGVPRIAIWANKQHNI